MNYLGISSCVVACRTQHLKIVRRRGAGIASWTVGTALLTPDTVGTNWAGVLLVGHGAGASVTRGAWGASLLFREHNKQTFINQSMCHL